MQVLSSRRWDAEVCPSNSQPHISRAELESLSITDRSQAVSQGSQDVLLQIPGAIVHLIVEGEESVEIGDGVFSLTRLTTDGRAIAVFASVGDNLRWPVTKDEPANKLDRQHYLFTLKVPQQVEEEGQNKELESEEYLKILNYGVTFRAKGSDESLLLKLDDYLRSYSFFKVSQGEQANSAPDRVQRRKGRLDSLEEFIFGTSNSIPDARSSPFNVSSVDKKPKSVDERSSACWTTLAPSVAEYNSSIAKRIGTQSGSVIDGVHRCSSATVGQLHRGGDYVKARVKKKEKPTQISPRTMKNIRRVRKVSRMTDRVAKGVLAGVVTATGVVSGSIVKSRGGKEFFKLVPGEVALASLDAFGKVFDAVELAGKSVLTSTSIVTSGVVSHRYGEEAGEASREGMATLGHWLSTAWTVSKIRKALSKPNNAKTASSKRALLKSTLVGATAKH